MLEWYALRTEEFRKGRLTQEKQVQTCTTFNDG